MQVWHYFLGSIEQLEQPTDGFLKLLASAGPHVPTQIDGSDAEINHRER
jgi:hypothetical protein